MSNHFSSLALSLIFYLKLHLHNIRDNDDYLVLVTLLHCTLIILLHNLLYRCSTISRQLQLELQQ
jgi:hypothetical protein